MDMLDNLSEKARNLPGAPKAGDRGVSYRQTPPLLLERLHPSQR